MIKYLGSKRNLVEPLTQIACLSGAATALDMFTGTTRVAQAFKNAGIVTAANDTATYSQILSDCYIATDAREIDHNELRQAVADLNSTKGYSGYFTRTFCEEARFFQPKNGVRVDAIRQRIENEFLGSWLYPLLLTSLMEAADRVDSTTGVQMAYLKDWAPRAYNDLELRVPQLLDGAGFTYREDANKLATRLTNELRPDVDVQHSVCFDNQTKPELIAGKADGRNYSEPQFDLVYLDPPYNQHRYFTNYHIWETLVRWDKPPSYGVANKRLDARDSDTHSDYNRRRVMPRALADLIASVPTQTLVLSYNNESWIEFEDLLALVSSRFEDCLALSFDYKRYVGAQIGIHNQAGKKVGKISHLKNKEYVFVGASHEIVSRIRRESDCLCVLNTVKV